MRDVFRNDQQKWFHQRLTRFPGVGSQLDLYLLVQRNAVFELQPLNSLGGHGRRVEVASRHYGRDLYEPILDSPAQRVVVDHVLERDGRRLGFNKRRGRQLKAQNGLQFINGLHAG